MRNGNFRMAPSVSMRVEREGRDACMHVALLHDRSFPKVTIEMLFLLAEPRPIQYNTGK